MDLLLITLQVLGGFAVAYLLFTLLVEWLVSRLE